MGTFSVSGLRTPQQNTAHSGIKKKTNLPSSVYGAAPVFILDDMKSLRLKAASHFITSLVSGFERE